MAKQFLSWDEVKKGIKAFTDNPATRQYDVILGIARGGIPVATLLSQELDVPMKIVDAFSDVSEFKNQSVLIADDILDTGRTLKHFQDQLPGSDTFVLVDKSRDKVDAWIVFPWETELDTIGGLEQAAVTLIREAGDDPNREGVLETPKRFAKAWKFWTQGYEQDPASVMKVFENPSLDQLVVVKDIEFYSMCEHHMAPFFGRVHVAYIPNGKVLGVSKFARLTHIFARRLQIQENLTKQIASTIMEHLQPKGVAVVVEAEHLCMKSRGVQTQNSVMQTSEMLGVFRDETALRAEFYSMIERGQK